MKAIEAIRWMVNESIECEKLSLHELDEDTDYTAAFGIEPAVRPESGTYLELWSDCISNSEWPSRVIEREDADGNRQSKRAFIQPDCVLMTDDEDRLNGGLTMILLFKLED